MPQWEDLTPWLKTQVLVMALNQWGLQTFNIHVHRKLEAEWMRTGKDPRVDLRNRLAREMRSILGRRREYFFVIEGWSKRDRAPTRLHIHGAGFIAEPGDGDRIMQAAARACGQGLRGQPQEPRAVVGRVYWKEGPAYVNYLFKSVRRPDARLDRRRLHMSREATGAAREMWGLMTRPR